MDREPGWPWGHRLDWKPVSSFLAERLTKAHEVPPLGPACPADLGQQQGQPVLDPFPSRATRSMLPPEGRAGGAAAKTCCSVLFPGPVLVWPDGLPARSYFWTIFLVFLSQLVALLFASLAVLASVGGER